MRIAILFLVAIMGQDAGTLARPLPHDVRAERAVLGAVLVRGENLLRVEPLLEERDFFLLEHQRIWRACRAVAGEGKWPDLITVDEWLRRNEESTSQNAARPFESQGKNEVGFTALLSSLMDGVAYVSQVEHYAGLIKEKSRLRGLIHTAYALQERALAEDGTARELIAGGVEDLLRLLGGTEEGGLHPWSEAVSGAMEELLTSLEAAEAIERGEQPAVRTMRLNFQHCPKLNEATGGFRRQEVVLLAGMTGHGKSTLFEQLWIQADDDGWLGQLYEAEMSKEACATRVLGHRAHVPLWKLRRMERVAEKTILKQALVSAAGEEMQRKVRVMDRGITPEKIWSLARLQKKTSGLDVIGIDYDMLVIREGMRQRRLSESEWGEQAEFMNQALECAKELDLCFVLLCQPRKVADELARGQRGPRLGEIYGSSSVENTAHVVMWIVRHYFQHEMKAQYEKKATAYVLKARNDRPQHVKLEFDDEMVLFRDAPVEKEGTRD